MLIGCESVATGESSVDCPAPEIAVWSDDQYDLLALEIEGGNPQTEEEYAALEKTLFFLLEDVRERKTVNVWGVAPMVYKSAIEYMIIREQIDACVS